MLSARATAGGELAVCGELAAVCGELAVRGELAICGMPVGPDSTSSHAAKTVPSVLWGR